MQTVTRFGWAPLLLRPLKTLRFYGRRAQAGGAHLSYACYTPELEEFHRRVHDTTTRAAVGQPACVTDAGKRQ